MYFQREAAFLLQDLAADLADASTPVVLTLEGPLGAGKTTFVKSFMQQLGFDPADVQSPTFLKLIEYNTCHHGLCLHLDCYRMDTDVDQEMQKLSLEAYDSARLWLVEWPEAWLTYLQRHPALRSVLGIKSYWHLSFSHSGSERQLQWQKLAFTEK